MFIKTCIVSIYFVYCNYFVNTAINTETQSCRTEATSSDHVLVHHPTLSLYASKSVNVIQHIL